MDLNNFPLASTYSLTLTSCGEDTETFGNFTFGPVITRSVLIQYCHCGSGVFHIDDNIFYVRRGDCIISFDGQKRLEIGSDAPWRFSWLYFTGETAISFLNQLNITPKNPVVNCCNESRIPAIFKEIIKIADTQGSMRDIFLGSKIFELFSEFATLRASVQTKLSSDLQEEYVSKALYYMNMHYMERELKIDAIAKNIGLNRSYLYALFKEQTGLSPQEYLARLRIKSACELLKLPQATVSSVANSVGYEPMSFTRTFKKIMGVTPNEYMKKSL